MTDKYFPFHKRLEHPLGFIDWESICPSSLDSMVDELKKEQTMFIAILEALPRGTVLVKKERPGAGRQPTAWTITPSGKLEQVGKLPGRNEICHGCNHKTKKCKCKY